MRLDMVLRGQEPFKGSAGSWPPVGRIGPELTDLRQEVSGAVERMGAALREDVGNRLSEIRTDNDRRLRKSAPPLIGSCRKRSKLAWESFRQVSERLERVHRGSEKCTHWPPGWGT